MEFDEQDDDQALPESVAVKGQKRLIDLSKKQAPFMNLISQFHTLFWDLPNISTKEVDGRLKEMFEDLLNAAAEVGIERFVLGRLVLAFEHEVEEGDLLDLQRVGEHERHAVAPAHGQLGGQFALGNVLETMGFKPVARHRSREVLLYRQGDLNIIVNAHGNGGVVTEKPQIAAIATSRKPQAASPKP